MGLKYGEIVEICAMEVFIFTVLLNVLKIDEMGGS